MPAERGVPKFMRFVRLGVLAATLPGCIYLAPWDRVHRSWIGHPVDEYIDVHGGPTREWPQDDGTSVYEYVMTAVDPSCVQYFVVDSERFIVDAYHEGTCVRPGATITNSIDEPDQGHMS